MRAVPDDWDGWAEHRRRRRERARAARRKVLFQISTAVAAAFLATVSVGLACGKLRQAREQREAALAATSDAEPPRRDVVPPPVVPTVRTHVDLATHLKKRGVRVKVESARVPGAPVPTSQFRDLDGTNTLVLVELHPSPAAAERAADARGPDGFAWGRFAFYTTDPRASVFRRRIRDALD